MSPHHKDIYRTEKVPVASVPAKMLHFAELRSRFERQMADYLADVGRRLREARLQNRPDLDSIPKASRELHEKFGIINSEKQYGRWELGKSEPRGAKREALAKMLRVRPEDIWGEPPIAPEEELRQQLNRIEDKLDRLLDYFATTAIAEAVEEAARSDSRKKSQSNPGHAPKKSQSRRAA